MTSFHFLMNSSLTIYEFPIWMNFNNITNLSQLYNPTYSQHKEHNNKQTYIEVFKFLFRSSIGI